MKAILSNTNPTADVVMHAVKNYHPEPDASDKAIISSLKEINATVKLASVFRKKTRNGGFVALPGAAKN